MLAPTSPPKQRGSARLLILALLVALVVGGIGLAGRAMVVDRQVHQRYDSALALAQVALRAADVAVDARRLQAARVTNAAPGAGERGAMQQRLDQLQQALAAIGAATLEPGARDAVEGLRRAVVPLAALHARRLAGDENAAAVPTEPSDLLERQASALDRSIAAVTAEVRQGTSQAAHGAASFLGVARVGIVGFALLIAALATLLAVLTLKTLRANRTLMQQLQQIARQDPLTGVVNRRGLDDALPLEFARATRSGEPLTLVMIDLDHFKRYNDRRGHAAGDGVLRRSAQGWLKQLRPTDLLVRYGGEEFTLVLPGCDQDQAALLVSRLRRDMPELQTFSAGIALWDGTESGSELLQRADAALLQAKKAGRNRSMIAGREPQATLPLRVA